MSTLGFGANRVCARRRTRSGGRDRRINRSAVLRAAVGSISCPIEALESRQYLSVSTDAGGWTVVAPSVDSRMIYVSSSVGSDTNNGLSPATPYKTIGKGLSQLRSGMPDELFLARGDSFTYQVYMSGGGRSATEPMLLSTYGDPTLPRPIVDATTGIGLQLGAAHYIDVIGIDFTSSTHDPSSPNFINKGSHGLDDVVPTDTILVEDCRFRNFGEGVNFQGSTTAPLSNIVFRRNQVVDSFATGGNSQGLYAESVNGLTLDGNLFDHNGWSTVVPGATANQFSQDVYLHSSNTGVVAINNIFANAASTGLQARAGGIIDNNLFIADPTGLNFGLVNGATAKAGGVTGEVIGNVFLKSRDISGSAVGLGLDLGNLKPGGNVVVSNNFFGEDTQGVNAAITFEPGVGVSNASAEVGINTLTVQNNIVKNWGYGVEITSALVPGGSGQTALNGLVIRNNDFQGMIKTKIIDQATLYDPRYEDFSGNRYSTSAPQSGWFTIQGSAVSFATWQSRIEPSAAAVAVPYVDGTRDVESYMTLLGITPSTDAYLAAVRNESKNNWDIRLQAPTVNTYILGGYVSDTTAPTAILSPVADVTADTTPTQTFTLTYADDYSINASSIATGNLLVSGPSGFSQVATLVNAPTANGATISATYSITAPNNTWTSLANGLYVVALQSGQVKDTAGNAIAPQNLGSFNLALGNSLSGGAIPAAPINFAAAGGSGGVTLSWSDPANDQSGFVLQRADDAAFATNSRTFPITGSSTAYTDATAAVGKQYFYQLIATNPAGPSAPTPAASATILPSSPVLQSTIFNDGNTLRTNVTTATLVFSQPVTLDGSMVGLISHTTQAPVSLSVANPTADGKTWIISFNGTGGLNGALADGTYDLNVLASHITNAFGQNAGVDVTHTFTVDVAPRVVAATYANSAPPHSLAFTFSKDVSASLSLSTLTVKNGSTVYPMSSYSWNASTLTATWTYSGAFPDNSSSYTATLPQTLIQDAGGIHLDGNGDGIAGDNYTFNFTQAKPTITLSTVSPVLVNTSVNLTFGSVNDPGQTVTQYVIHWGDGTSNTFTSTGQASHTYTTPGIYAATADLTDANGTHTSSGSMSIQVNRALASLSGNNANANVTGVYTLALGSVTDPGQTPTGYVVHWGDGTSTTYATGGPFTHVYTKTGSDTISVDVVDSVGTSANAGSIKVSVTVSPTIGPTGNFSANQNGVYRLILGTPSDTGYSVSGYLVHWGDGTTTSATTNANPLTHTYTVTGAKAITIDLTDATGTFVSAGSLAITVHTPPTLVLNGNSVNTQGLLYTLTPGTLTDPGYSATGYLVHWGDGTSTAYSVGDPITHTYSATGSMNITVDLTDGTGTFVSAGSKTIVVNPAQAINFTADPGDNDFYLKLDGDHQTLDLWLNSSTPGVGTPNFQFTSASALTLSGNGGNDTFTLDESGGTINLPGGVTFSGNSGTDSLLILGTTANDTLNMTDGGLSFDNGQVYWINVPSITYDTVGGSDTTSVSGITPLTMNLAGSSETINAAAGSNVTVNLNSFNGNLTINGSGNTTLNFGDANPNVSFNAALSSTSGTSSSPGNSSAGSSGSSIGSTPAKTPTPPAKAPSTGGSKASPPPAPKPKAPAPKPSPVVQKKTPPVTKPIAKKVVVPVVKPKVGH